MKKNINYTIVSVLLLGSLTLKAQDIHFSQLTESSIVLNPAEAGLGHDILAELNYKDQWRSVSSLTAYKTFNASADFGILKNDRGSRLGLGVNFFSDKAGDANMSSTIGNLHVSGVLAAGESNLISAGIFSGFGQRGLNGDALMWDEQYDGQQYNSGLPTGESQAAQNFTYLDMGAGLAWFYGEGHSTLSSNDARCFNIGLAVHHLNQPVYSYYGAGEKLPMKYVMHGTGEIGVKNFNMILEPAYLVMIQAGHHEINAGMMFKFLLQDASQYTGRKKPSAFSAGGYYRFGDAFVLNTRYEYSGFSLGLSYDLNLSDLKAASRARGGFELSLRYMNPDPFTKGSATRLFD